MCVSARFDSPKFIQPKHFHLKQQASACFKRMSEKKCINIYMCVAMRLVSFVLNRRAHTHIIFTEIGRREKKKNEWKKSTYTDIYIHNTITRAHTHARNSINPHASTFAIQQQTSYGNGQTFIRTVVIYVSFSFAWYIYYANHFPFICVFFLRTQFFSPVHSHFSLSLCTISFLYILWVAFASFIKLSFLLTIV